MTKLVSKTIEVVNFNGVNYVVTRLEDGRIVLTPATKDKDISFKSLETEFKAKATKLTGTKNSTKATKIDNKPTLIPGIYNIVKDKISGQGCEVAYKGKKHTQDSIKKALDKRYKLDGLTVELVQESFLPNPYIHVKKVATKKTKKSTRKAS